MFGYITIGVSDMEQSIEFYDALFAELGAKLLFGQDRIKFYGTGQGPMIAICTPYDEGEQHCGNGNMVAIPADGPEGVKRLYDRAIELGATCEGAPGERLPIFYGAYVRDRDGNKICFYEMKT